MKPASSLHPRDLLASLPREIPFAYTLAAICFGVYHFAPGAEWFAGLTTGLRVDGVELGTRDLKVIWRYGLALLFLGVVPILCARIFFGRKPADYGLAPRGARWNGILLLVGLPLIVISDYIALGDPDFRALHPQLEGALQSWWVFGLSALCYAAFYIGYEIFFRGFLLFETERHYGPAAAILISMLTSSLIHIARPQAEYFSSILVGFIWAWFALKTRSLWGVLIQHMMLGIFLDFLYTLARSA